MSRPRMETLEERRLLATFSDGLRLIGNQSFNEAIFVDGDATVTVLGNLTLGSLAHIQGDGVGGDDKLTLDVRGSIIVGGDISGGGLTDFSAEASGDITVGDSVVVDLSGDFSLLSSAVLDPTLDILNPLWTTNSSSGSISIGDVDISANDISVISTSVTDKYVSFGLFEDGLVGLITGNNPAENDPATRLGTTFTLDGAVEEPTIERSQGNWLTEGFRAGMTIKIIGSSENEADDYKVTAVTDKVLTLSDNDVIFNESRTNLTFREIITSISAEDVPLVANGRDGNPLGIGTVTTEQISDLLLRNVAESNILDINLPFESVSSDTAASVIIGAGATFDATGNVTLLSSATTDVGIDSPGLLLGAVHGKSEGTATTTVESGAQIEADGTVLVRAAVDNDLLAAISMRASTVIGLASQFVKIPGPQAGFAYGYGRSNSTATVANGATISGGHVNVEAENVNNFEISAQSKARPGGGLGAAIGIVISDTESNSLATIDGEVIATGEITVDSKSINNHEFEANAVVREKAGFPVSQALGKVKSKIKALQISGRADAGNLDVAAGAVFDRSINKANATVTGNANVTAGTDMNVTARAEDNFRAYALGAAKAAGKVSLGGAFTRLDRDNTANAKITGAANVDVANLLTIKADAVVPNQILVDEDIDAVRNIHVNDPSLTGDDPIAVFNSLESFYTSTGQSIDALTRLGSYLGKVLGIDQRVATLYSHSAAQAGSAKNGEPGRFAASGSVVALFMDNTADASIGSGAVINSDRGHALAGQSVNVAATSHFEAVSVGNIPSLKSLLVDQTGNPLTVKSEGSAVGGTLQAIHLDNVSLAHIDDGATVTASQDISVDADTFELMVSVIEAGGSAKKIGVTGVFAWNDLHNQTKAWIDDRAVIVAGRDLVIDADHVSTVVTVAGTITSAGSIGVGASAVLNEILHEQ